MKNSVYEKLRARLDTFPTSFPKTEEGIELAILEKLFSQEEAEIASMLPLMGKEPPQDIQTISVETHKDADVLRRILENMHKKGLVHVEDDKASKKFSLLPFLPGIYEFSFDQVDRELADLLDRYMPRYLYREAFKSKAPMGRLIPVGKSISSHTTVHPYEDMVRAIETSSSLAVAPCICRTRKKALDKGCDYPVDVCLYLNDFGDHLNEIGKGRPVTREEALDILQKTEEAGLVHLSMNTRMTNVICSCCPCCCDGFKGLIKLAKMEKLEMGPVMNFQVVLDEDRCTLCETCIGRCHAEALEVKDDGIALNSKRCIGCGLCVSGCPEDALSLERKPEPEIKPSPDDVSDLFSEMGWRE